MALASHTPRHRAHGRGGGVNGVATGVPRSTTREGAIGTVGRGGARGAAPLMAGIADVAGSNVRAAPASGWPHVTQKRRPRWFVTPHMTHRMVASPEGARPVAWGGEGIAGESPAVGDTCARAMNRKSGACGRAPACGASAFPSGTVACGGASSSGGCAGDAGLAIGICGAGRGCGAYACGICPAGDRPIGGVGAATRGPSRCPHSWQKTRCSAFLPPQVLQITRMDGTSAKGARQAANRTRAASCIR